MAMMQSGGAGFLSGAAGGFFGSLGATAWSAGAGKFANSGVGTIAFGALSGGVGAELAGGNFWQGAVTGGLVAGLNHYLHKAFKDKLTLDEFAKAKFGVDYRKKYGVKSLQWASKLPKEGIIADGVVYTYNSKTQYITSSDGANEIGGIQQGGVIHIADVFMHNPLILEATLGHEFIHAYHHKIFGNNFSISSSEHVAYSYSVDFYTKNNLDPDVLRGLKYSRDWYVGSEEYGYKLTPGF